MPKHAFSPDEIGKAPRYYDTDENEEFKNEVLNWLENNELLGTTSTEETKRFTESLLKKLKKLEKDKKNPKYDLQEIATDLYYSVRDFFSGRRRKTSALIIGGILVGAGIGAFLGTWLLPVIGTAIGGVVGGIIVAAVTAIGIFGFTLLGAGLGSWIGSKISNRFFKNEKKFQIGYRQAKKIKKNLGLGWKDAEMINGYLRNRMNAVSEDNPEYKMLYSLLRKLVIETPQNKNLSIAIAFFKNELTLLEEQKKRYGNTPSVEQDINAVIHILRSFGKDKIKKDVLRQKDKRALNEFCNQYDKGFAPAVSVVSSSPQTPPPVRIRQTTTPIGKAPEKKFKQSQTSIEKLNAYFDDHEKYVSCDLASIKYAENSLDKATLIFNNPSMKNQYEMFAENGKDSSVYFSTNTPLEDADFEFVAESAAKVSMKIATEDSVIDLTIASPSQQFVLYRAFMKARGDASFPEILASQEAKEKYERHEEKKREKNKIKK